MADRVTFTRSAAERIASVVRTVEAGNRDTGALPTLPRLGGGGGGKPIRICTYTGPWSIGSSKVVTFKNQTATPNTASATNLFLPLPSNGTRDCAIAKDGSAWYLIQAQFDTAQFVANVSLTTSAIEFTRYEGVSLGTASTVSILITTCATATA